MKRSALSNWRFALWLVLPVLAIGSTAAAAPDTGLDNILTKMDETASKFRNAQANFTWTTYNSVVNAESGKQTGKIYFRRVGNETEMSAEIDPPDAQKIIFSKGKIQIYKSRMGTVDVYDAGAHREEFEAFLVLGFGSSGEDMRKSFDVSYGGEEKIDGIDAAKLDLVPKSEKIKQHFPQIVLWIDPKMGVSVQQKLVELSGDYRLAKYSSIQLNQKIPDKVFKLKTSGKAKVLTH
jgi:outer membrane lipoprotein-sorting protein